MDSFGQGGYKDPRTKRTIEGVAVDIFILYAADDPTHRVLVEIVPNVRRDFLQLLHVDRATRVAQQARYRVTRRTGSVCSRRREVSMLQVESK